MMTRISTRSFLHLPSNAKRGQLPFSTTYLNRNKHCKIVIAGGGSGGITMAAKLRRHGIENITLVEPSKYHYYQPYWTLVGGRKKVIGQSCRRMTDVLPSGVTWLTDRIIGFDPESNTVQTEQREIQYELLIVALGINLAFEKIKGLPAALGTPGVCSNYSLHTVQDTARCLDQFEEGNAIFTQPPNPIKCGGAPQKIMYLAEEYFTKHLKRDKSRILFNTALHTMFVCPYYAKELEKIAISKDVEIGYGHNLVEVRPQSKEAVFQKLDSSGKDLGTEIQKYEMLHITPPMVSPRAIRESKLAAETGFMDIHMNTLRSNKFDNVFGIGDCTSLPTSKTAAAVASQSGVLVKNVVSALKGKPLNARYYGYTSCPLVTGYNKGVIAEFNYNLLPEETLPIDQAKERRLFYLMKANLMPYLYWDYMLKGYWSGPKFLRKWLHLGLSG